MSSEREMERLALKVAELSGELIANIEAGADLLERRQDLEELRRQIEALESQATLVAIKLNRQRS